MSNNFNSMLFFGASILAVPVSANAQAGPEEELHTNAAAAISGRNLDGNFGDLLEMPLEDLLTIEATSVVKKRQRVSNSSAAVFVITQDDIRRSSASTIPQLLRMVPGMEVAEIQNSATGVTTRGFNGLFANSLLVMIDGRAIYFASLGGVFWNQQLLPLSDIERIEVVRGPGATLWGSNAANGVINIISKHSGASLGVNVDGRLGNREQLVNLSYSGRVGDDIGYRVYGAYRRDLDLTDAQGQPIGDPARSKALGTRIDFEPGGIDAITFQADYADGVYQRPELVVDPDLLKPGYITNVIDSKFHDFSVLGRWVHSPSRDLDISSQAYFSRNEVEIQRIDGAQTLIDLDLGIRWRANQTHEINFGLGWRQSISDIVGPSSYAFQRNHIVDHWLNGYIQDDITLIRDRLNVTLGTKLEHNSFTGYELQPSVRVMLKPTQKLSLWGSISRAVRTPTLIEREGDFRTTVTLPGTAQNPLQLPVYSHILGRRDQQSVRITAYEMGLRSPIARGWSIDINGYYSVYDRISTADFVSITPLFQAPVSFLTLPPTPVGLETNLAFGNSGHLESWGVEAFLSGRLADWWKLDLTLSHLEQVSARQADSLFSSPKLQFGLRSATDVSDNFSIDWFFRHVGEMQGGATPAYSDLDLRVTYRPKANLELSLVGKALLTDRHLEYGLSDFPGPASYVPRSVSVQARARF